tara:strand:+ start:1628 stop:1912 length:285 start_codon:yes stop_codon:yes gene_type:complete
MFSILNPNPGMVNSALHPTYHYEEIDLRTGPSKVDELSSSLRNLKVSQPRNTQMAPPPLHNNHNTDMTRSNNVKVKTKLPGHQLIKAYKRLKGK